MQMKMFGSISMVGLCSSGCNTGMGGSPRSTTGEEAADAAAAAPAEPVGAEEVKAAAEAAADEAEAGGGAAADPEALGVAEGGCFQATQTPKSASIQSLRSHNRSGTSSEQSPSGGEACAAKQKAG